MTRRTVMVWGRWLLLFTITSLFFSRLTSFPELRISHGVLVYLLLIVGASREGGRGLSAVMVLLGYLAVDWFFVPPVRSFGRPSEWDLVILVGFLITATVISQLVINLRQTASVATDRAAEIERLSAERLVLEREASRSRVLQEAERLKNALIASLSHDLRSPITTLIMLADRESGVSPDVALARVGDEAQRLEAFLSTLGRFTKSGSFDRLLVVEPHVVEDLIGTAIRSTESVLGTRTVQIVSPPAEELLMVRCDFTLSLQILGNMLANAAHYSPADAPIEISAIAEGRMVRISVADRGPGLADDELEQVFRPMERGRAASVVTSGTGMGLAIARTFAKAQHGDVTYEARDGGGSRFHLLLPAAGSHAGAVER